MKSKPGRHTRALPIVLSALVIGGAILAYVLSRGSDQAQVSADVLPLIAGVGEVAEFTDCSKVSAVAYFENNPCETFVVLRDDHFRSQAAFLAAENRELLRSGWRHPTIAPPIDYNLSGPVAPIENSWFAPGHEACAYVASDQAAVNAEGTQLLPFDQQDNPRGLLDFYRAAKSAQSGETLWVRLRPPVMVETGAC